MGHSKHRQKATAGQHKDWSGSCLLTLLAGWMIWIGIDLARLGVFSGRRSLGAALFDMPSLLPLLLLVASAPVAVTAWLRSRRKWAFPSEPWMWERRWNRTGAHSPVADKVWGSLLFTVLVTATVAALGIVAYTVALSEFLAIALVPFYVFAVGLWIWLGVRVARILRFGRPFFRYATFPFFLGTDVQGDLEGVERIEGFTRLTVTLRCVREQWERSGRRHLFRQTIREETHEVGPTGIVPRVVASDSGDLLGATRPVIPVRFELREGDLSTQLLADPAYKWELLARAERPGFDFEATFLLPVYSRPPAD